MDDAVEFRVEPATTRFDAHDERWLAQVGDLRTDLQREVGDVRLERAPVAGTKGTLDTLLLSIGSATTLTAAVEFLKAWLQRDVGRSIKVSWSDTGEVREVEMSGASVDGDAIEGLLRSVTARLAE